MTFPLQSRVILPRLNTAKSRPGPVSYRSPTGTRPAPSRYNLVCCHDVSLSGYSKEKLLNRWEGLHRAPWCPHKMHNFKIYHCSKNAKYHSTSVFSAAAASTPS